MRALTGEASALAAWKRFFEPKDVVAIKVNAGGRQSCVSNPVIVAEIARRLMEVGIAPERIVVYERFIGQLDEVKLPHLPAGVLIQAARARTDTGAGRRAARLGRCAPTSRPSSSARRTRAPT